MAIQNRRGAYTDFDPTKMVAGEFAVVQSGDENTEDGKALYVAPTTGSVKRIPFADELGDLVEIDDTLTEAGAAADAKKTGDEIADLKSDLSDVNERIDDIEPGLSDNAKEALLACFENVAWKGQDGQVYYNALREALYADAVDHIVAVFTPGTHEVYTTDNIEALRNFLTVTAYYNNGTQEPVLDYELSGDISSVGTKTITVIYDSTNVTTFNVTVVANSSGILYEWDFTKGLNDLRQNKTAILGTGERVDYPDYSGSLHIGEGTTLPRLTVNGLLFDNAQQWCRLFARSFNSSEYLADKTVQVDVASFSYAPEGEYNVRLITFADPAARWATDSGLLDRFQAGFIFRTAYGWNYNDGWTWNDEIFSGMTGRNDISGHRISLVLNNFTYPKLYVDGVYKGIGNKDHEHIMYGLQIGSGDLESAGGSFYNALITGVRIYSGEVA